MVFPFDIVTLILEQLDQVEDVDTLRSLSRCCSDLRPLSQRRIFHTVDIKHYNSHRNRQNFNKVLRLHDVLQSPRIADYVRSFEFCFLLDDITLGPCSTVTKVAAILSRLHRVKALVWIAFVNGSLDWVSFSANDRYKDLAQAILRVIPNLTFLKIDKIQRFPLDMMSGGNVLLDVTEDTSCTISLAVVSDNDRKGRDAMKSSPSIRILHYNIGSVLWPRELKQSAVEGVHCLHSVKPPLPPFDFARLQTLQVTWQGSGPGSRYVKDTQKIMNCAPTLKEFTCIVPPGCTFTGLSRVIQAHKYGSLTTLNLKVTRSMDPERSQRRPLATLCRELSILGHNHLERLSITIDLPEYTSGMNQRDLQDIDAKISRDKFLSLKAVDVLINIVKASAFSIKTLVSKQAFDSMDELGIHLGSVYGGYCNGLLSMEGLVFSCKVMIK